MSKHTPGGRWVIDGYNLTAVIAEIHDMPRNYQHICDCNFGTSDPMKYLELNKANAKFIVQACNSYDELLEALKSQEIWLEQEIGEWISVDISQCSTQVASMKVQLNEIQQAIAKAEGSQK